MNSKKTFLIINQTAGSPYHGMVYRNYYIAREWVKQGHRAIIISGSYFHNFSKFPETKGLFTKEEIDGIEYWWVKIPQYSQSRSLGRLFSVFLFPFLLLFFPFWKLGKPETVIVSGPPHVSVMNAWLWARIWGSTLIYEVRDIWPLTIVKLGNVSPYHPIILLLSFLERIAYMAADRVVSVLALANRHFEKKGMIPSKFAYIPNGVDTSSEALIESTVSKQVKEIAKTKRVVIYAGSFGIANNLDQMIDAALILKDKQDIHFIFVGDGPHKAALKAKASNLSNVSFFGPVPKKEIHGILSHAHITYVGLMKSDLFKHGVSPNKLFDYMAARKPVIMAIDTEDNIVGKADCGISVPSCEPRDIADAVSVLVAKSDSELQQLGNNGRRYLEENHTYDSLAKKYIQVASEARKTLDEPARWIVSPFWLGFWLVMMMGMITHFIFPMISPQNFKNGITTFLLDPHIFHDLGVQVANMPWSQFDLRPNSQFPAGVLAFIYKVTGIHQPYMLLPVLALLAGLTIRGITSCLDVLNVKGRWWPIFIAVIMTVTPTSISWMVYPHKDAFIVPGVVLIAWSFMAVTLRSFKIRHVFTFLLGTVLVLSNKIYFSEIFILSTLLTLPIALLQPSSLLGKYARGIFFTLCLVLFASIAFLKKGYIDDGQVSQSTSVETSTTPASVESEVPRHVQTKRNWQNLPGGKIINQPILALAYTRERFLHIKAHGQTNFHPEIHLQSALDTIAYIPRALQLAFLEPLPWRTGAGGLAKRILFHSVQLEMIILYISIFFLIITGPRRWSPAVWVCLALSLPFLIILGISVPNIGSINRYRFPFLLLIKLAGLAALWASDRTKWPGRLLMWIDPPKINRPKKKLLFLVPDDATFVIQRLVMAQGAQKAGYDVHVACPDEGHAQKIRDLGFTFHQLDLNRGGLNPFADFMPFVRLVFFLSKERPDILQCVSIKPVIYGATAGTIVGLKKIVCLVNGLGYAFEGTDLKGKIVKFVAKALYRNAFALPGIRVIFQNPDDRDYFVKEQLVAREKTIIIRGSGVNMQKFVPTPQPQNEKPIILFVGRLLWSKGVRELVEAAKTLKTEGLKFELQIIGAPDDRNPEAVPTSYLKEQQELGIVNWLGRQSDMPRFFREADIVALPTVYNEGLPLTLLEAASTGRTLISTDAQGCREIVRHNVNGYLIPPHGVKELTERLRTLIQNPDLRKQFGETSTKIVREEFSAEIVQQQLLAVYYSLLNDSVRPAFQPVTSN